MVRVLDICRISNIFNSSVVSLKNTTQFDRKSYFPFHVCSSQTWCNCFLKYQLGSAPFPFDICLILSFRDRDFHTSIPFPPVQSRANCVFLFRSMCLQERHSSQNIEHYNWIHYRWVNKIPIENSQHPPTHGLLFEESSLGGLNRNRLSRRGTKIGRDVILYSCVQSGSIWGAGG